MTDSQHRYINEDGTVTTLSLHHALRGIFIKLINKGSNIVRALSSRFDRWHLTASERYTRQNCAVVRTFVREYIRQRKQGQNKSKFNCGQNFLDYLLADEYFSQNAELIVDEVLDFFIAATQTTASTT